MNEDLCRLIRDKYGDAAIEFSVMDPLVNIGKNEDGDDVLYPEYFLTACFPDGRRLRHCKTWGPRWVHSEPDEEGYVCLHVEPADLDAALSFCGRVMGRYLSGGWNGPSNPYWFEIEPVYGSRYYVQTGGDRTWQAGM
jgi:hypothetical protein